MKKTLLLVILLYTSLYTGAQSREIDSLLKVLKTTRPDSNKVKLLNRLSQEFYVEGDYDKELQYAQQALGLAKKIKWKPGQANALLMTGNAYDDLGLYVNALENCLDALEIYRQIDNKAGMARVYNTIGIIHHKQANYPEALRNLYSSLKIREQIDDKKGTAISYNNIGNAYFRQDNHSEALKNYQASLSIYQQLDDKKGISDAYNHIGMAYSGQKNYTQALYYHELAVKIKKEIDDKRRLGYAYNNIGLVYALQGNYDEALRYHFASLEIDEFFEDKPGMAYSYTNIANIYIQQGRIDEGRKWYLKALELGMELGAKNTIYESYLGLAQVDSAMGNYRNAFEKYKLSIVYRDSILNEENTEKTVQAKMQYEFDKRQAADSLKIAEERKINALKFEEEKKQKYYLYAGLALVLIFAGFMFNRFKVTQKQKQLIEIKEKEAQHQKQLVEEKNKEIFDSINYAERLQRSLMANQKLLDTRFSEYFIYFNPKEAVSGDFYWASYLSNGNFTLAVADSTGHGVPGAIMSMMNMNSLKESVQEKICEPHLILSKTRQIIIDTLCNDGSAEGGKDGMDVALLVFDHGMNKLDFALANNALWLVRNGILTEYEADKMPVGKHDNQNKPFSKNTIHLAKGDMIYVFTDGYADQFGGEKGKKFKYASLEKLLVSIAGKTMAEQKLILHQTFESWKGALEQIDDVTVVGIRI